MEGRVVDVCPAYDGVWLHDVSSLMGQPWFHAVHPADVSRVERARECLLLDGQAFDEEYRIIRGDGSTRWVRDRAFYFPEVRRIAGVAHDVSGVHEAAEGREHAQKLQTLGMLASSIAHDFGNLIQGVGACLDLALRDTVAQEKSRQYVKEAHGALRSGAALTKQLTGFSRKDVAAAVPIALDDVVTECASVLRHLLGHPIELVVDLRAPGCEIWAQPVQIEQILLNLAANARDAMPEGGVLCIRTRSEGEPASPVASRRVRLDVVDSGCGMSADTRARMFEPFFTTKPAGEGTGLGLAVVRAVTAALRGQLRVESELGHGTAFIFSFPEVPASVRAGSSSASVNEGDAEEAAASSDELRAARRTTGVFRRERS